MIHIFAVTNSKHFIIANIKRVLPFNLEHICDKGDLSINYYIICIADRINLPTQKLTQCIIIAKNISLPADKVCYSSSIATVVGELPQDSCAALSGYSLGKRLYHMLEIAFLHLVHCHIEVDCNRLTMKKLSLLCHPS